MDIMGSTGSSRKQTDAPKVEPRKIKSAGNGGGAGGQSGIFAGRRDGDGSCQGRVGQSGIVVERDVRADVLRDAGGDAEAG